MKEDINAVKEFLNGLVEMANAAPGSPEEREAAAESVAVLAAGMIGVNEEDVTPEERQSLRETVEIFEKLTEPKTYDFVGIVLKKTMKHLVTDLEKGGK